MEDDPAEVVHRQGSSVRLAITVEVDESAEGAVTVRVLSLTIAFNIAL